MRLLIGILCFVVFEKCFSQKYTIQGKVFNAGSKEPVPFASVLLKGTGIGTNTDFDGNFKLLTNQFSDSLIVLYIGYQRMAVALKNTEAQIIQIAFMPSNEGINLDEVVVKAGENPAHRIIRAAISRKKINDKNHLHAYEYEVYNKLDFDLNNIPGKFKNNKAFKPINVIFNNIDSVNSAEKPSLPLFMVETLSEVFYRDHPKQKKEIIKASKISGVQNSSISQIMGDMYQNINIYDNELIIFGKDFKSPLSDNAIFHYRFYLEDSLFLDNTWCYHIRFKPKREHELCFTGNMWIADSSFGVKRMEMSIPQHANINFIQAASLIQEYALIDTVWMLKKDRIVIDFIPSMTGLLKSKHQPGIYGRKTTSYSHILINKPKDESFFNFSNAVRMEEGATKKNTVYWDSVRHDSLSEREKKIYHLIDTIQGLRFYKRWSDAFTILVSGYTRAGNFEIGPLYKFYSNNVIEGSRYRFGGRTSSQFSRWHELNGYVAYGDHDQKWKYGIGFKAFLAKKPFRQIIGMDYKNDLELLGQSQNGFTNDNLFATFLRRVSPRTLTRVAQTQIWYDKEWFHGFNTKISFINRTLNPVGNYQYYYLNQKGDSALQSFIRTSEIRFTARFAYQEKYINGDFSRTSLGTRYPVIQVTYTHSMKHLYEGQYNYQKIVLNVSDRIRWGALLGYTDYMLESGIILGKVPYPLLELHGGNQTFVYDYMAYNLMNYYEFASDRYASFWMFHHFEGLFFNKIPLLKKLKWREVASYKILFGSVQNKQQTLLFPNALHTLNNGPYQELSAGIENIFRFFRVDAVWRLNYTQNSKIPFGIKIGFQLAF